MGKKKEEPSSEYGDPAQYDPTFNGPIHNRSCTDIICCVLFMLVITGYMVVGILAWLYGDPRHVLYPRNSTGMYCGISPNQDKPNVFYFNILQCATATNIMAAALQGLQCPTTQICVKSCPSDFWALNPLARQPNANLSLYFNQDLCVPWLDLSTTKLSASDIISKEYCPYFYTPTSSVLGRCLPNFGASYNNIPSDFKLPGLTTNETVNMLKNSTSDHSEVLVEGVLLLILIFLRTRILIAIALIKESSKAVGYMMSTLCYPIVTFVAAPCRSVCRYLATSGAPLYNVVALNSSQGGCSSITGNQTCNPLTFNSTLFSTCPSARCVFIKYNTEGLFQRNIFNLQIYNVIAFLWCVNFVIALGHCTLAGAFASYYWAFHKPADIPACPLVSSFMRALRYHVGSLAFGALILTIVQLIRIILEYIDHKCRAAQNPCARFLLCCLKCCFWCLEKFIKFLNRNAYIMIAIYGKNFCVSAKNAFLLLMRNILRVVVLDKVTDLLLFFGKLLVVGGIGVLAFFFFSGKIQVPGSLFEASKLNYYWMPIITVVVGAYLIAHGFFSVYNMCVDTLFLCFLEDLERNDGSAEKPYYMSKNLMKILNKKNKQPKK
ncbi:hypothetical protein MHYP_G00169890 [Metynnis hypsauchen]